MIGTAAVAGAATFGYAAVVERNWFALRRYDVPVLSEGAKPLRILHISDAHLTPGRHRLMSWIRSLDALEPDVVVNTGDSIANPESVQPFLEALGPLLDRPGVFVYGSNDLYSPVPRNPARYIWRTSALDHHRDVIDLPWAELGEGMAARGWLDANNQRGRIKAGDADIEVAGVHDSHIDRDRYDEVAGAGDPSGRPAPRRPALTRALQCLTGSPPTASTCCWPGTRTAARSACLARRAGDQLRHRPVPGERAAPASGRGAGGAAERPGCTSPLVSAHRRGPRSGSAAGRKQRCSRWSRGSARLLARSAGCGAAWQRASFGTKRPRVQIPPPRPFSCR